MGADVVYVDVDDTLVRSASTKRIPIPASLAKVRSLHTAGATMYLWSAGGAEYARTTAIELGIADCFAGFLPKPTVIIDDQHITEWQQLRHYFPTDEIIL